MNSTLRVNYSFLYFSRGGKSERRTAPPLHRVSLPLASSVFELKPFSRICAPRLVARSETRKPVFAMRRWLKIKAPRILSPSALHPPPRNFLLPPVVARLRGIFRVLLGTVTRAHQDNIPPARSVTDRIAPRSSINNRVHHLSSRICSPGQDGARKDRCFPSNSRLLILMATRDRAAPPHP